MRILFVPANRMQSSEEVILHRLAGGHDALLFDLHIHTGRQIELHERVDRLSRWALNVQQALMRAHLELFPGFFVDKGGTVHRVLLNRRGERHGANHVCAGPLGPEPSSPLRIGRRGRCPTGLCDRERVGRMERSILSVGMTVGLDAKTQLPGSFQILSLGFKGWLNWASHSRLSNPWLSAKPLRSTKACLPGGQYHQAVTD